MDMAERWKDVRREAVEAGRLREEGVAGHRERELARVRGRRLADMREACGLGREAVAERLRVPPSCIARMERGDVEGVRVDVLRAYVRELGGELEVTARFGDERITIG